jgi:SNARE protein
MSEIEEFDEQLMDLLDAVKKVLQGDIPRLKGAERLEKCSYLKNRLNRAKQLHRSILVEARDLPAERAGEWLTRAKTYEKDIQQFMQDVEYAEISSSNDPTQQPRRNVEEMTAKELTTQALAVQDMSLAATDRIKKTVLETEQIAIAVSSEVKNQGDQIGRINEAVDQVETNVKRAQKQMRAFMRRMATDKIFLVFMLLIVGAILAIIIKQYVYPKAAAAVTKQASSSTSSTSTGS